MTQLATRQGAGRAGRRVATISTTMFMFAFAVYFLFPLWYMIVASTKTRTDIVSTPGLWFAPNFALGQNLTDLFSYNSGVFGRWALNSFLYAGVGGALGTLFAVMMGYALAKYVFRGRDTIFNIVLGGVLVPGTALALPLFLMFSGVQLTNTVWAIFLPSLVSPFGVYLARIYATASVPDELLEAARIDGSSEFRTFFTMSIRLMAPALVTVFLFHFTHIWNSFFLPLIMLQDSSLYPLNLGLFSWNTNMQYAPELRVPIIVGSLISIVPVIIAFLALQRYWRTGLADGGVKG